MEGHFEFVDYSVFIGSLVISLSIGIYLAILDKRRGLNTPDEYFLAGRSPKTWPVVVSYVVSFQSSLLILGTPVEVYEYGMIYCLYCVGLAIAFLFGCLVIVPVFHPLKLTSVNTYLYMRYGDNLVRYLSVFTAVVYSVFYMATVIFGTCIAADVFIGIPYWITVILFTIVTTIYVSIGGIKAVIWTDVFQMLIMTSGILAVLVKSVTDIGGVSSVQELAGNRLSANEFGLDPKIRYTVWNLTFGSISMFLYLCVSQTAIQRISSMPNIRVARLVYILSAPIYALMLVLAGLEGVTLFAYHASKGCDIINGDVVKNVNELLPFSVIQLFDKIPGINGLFVASLSSAALSTLSSCLSSLSAITYEDVLRVKYPNMTDGRATRLAKLTVIVYGLLCLVLTFVIGKLPGSILQIFMSFMGCIDGPTAGIFVLSLLFRRGTSKGVFFGAVCGMTVSFWLIMGKTMSSLPPDQQLPPGPIDTCWQYTNTSHALDAIDGTLETNITSLYNTTANNVAGGERNADELSAIETLYSISYMYFSLIGFVVTIIAGVVISCLNTPLTCVKEEYVFSFRKHIMCDLFGKDVNPELRVHARDDQGSTQEMEDFINNK